MSANLENQKSINISELFYSIQGEGRYMGVPSVFLRTFGCNFKCQGFGCSTGTVSDEYLTVNPELYTKYDELPLVKTGCDSYASWDPRFNHLSRSYTTDELVDAIVDLLPNKEWRQEHLVITGGEPLLGWQSVYPDLLKHPKMLSLRELTFETNGTQPLDDKFRYYLMDWMLSPKWGKRGRRALTFSVGVKLSNSGEPRDIAIRPEIIKSYEDLAFTYLKYAVASEEDVNEAVEVTNQYREAGFTGPVYLMPIGGVAELYTLNKHRIAELALKHGLRYSDRLQFQLFGSG